MRQIWLAVPIGLMLFGSALAEDYVIIESKTFHQRQRNCQLGVYFANEGPIAGLVFTFEVRELDHGVYPAANLSFFENPMSRLYYSPLGSHSLYSMRGSQTFRFYDEPGSTYCSTPPTNSYTTYVAWHSSHYPNPDNPDGMLFGATAQGEEYVNVGYVYPGADTPGVSLPSLIIEFDAGTSTGRFEIDTCCVTPANHLLYLECASTTPLICRDPYLVTPAFTKSIVTIAPCICLCVSDPNCDGVTNILDVATAIDVAFRGNADIMDSTCAITRTDTNADYQTDIVDVVRLILVAFREGDAATYLINPCAEE